MTSERIDFAGRVHPPAGTEPRIVSLVPSITELLFDLGLGPFVAGRTTFCVHPREGVGSVPRVGGTKTVRLDRLRRLRPTHVIVNVDENRKGDVEAIESFAPHVIVTHPLEPGDNPGLFRLLGAIFGREAAAERLADDFAKELASLRETATHLPPRRVLYLIWKEPWMTVSRDTYISRTLALVNWTTAAHDAGVRYPEVELDEALFAAIDLVLLSSEPYPFKPAHAGLVRAAPGGSRVPVAHIDAEMVSWYGSRAIRGLRYLAGFAARSPRPPGSLSTIIAAPQ